MNNIKFLFITLIVFSLCSSCKKNNDAVYQKEISDWRESRLERLKSKTGWLNLAGLFWLKEGENTFGSDSSNMIVFPPAASLFYGSIQKTGDHILLKAKPDANIRIDSFQVNEISLVNDSVGKPTILESGGFAWYIIKRDGRYGVRLRDYNNPRIEMLTGIPAYDTDDDWRIVADFVPYPGGKIIETTTIIGGTEQNICQGELVFRKGFKKYTLLPFSEGDQLFIIFADKTNGIETYGNGRFLYASMPDADNKVILDFNKAYNPPCAFSPFATCPMPPRENILDLEIKAGEREVDLFHHNK
jgi:uncharacterized protein (DUF1684 family)